VKIRAYRRLSPDEWYPSTAAGKRSASGGERESVRQWAIAELVETYGYPREWLGERILVVPGGGSMEAPKEFFGLCLLTAEADPFLWVSVGRPGESGDSERKLRDVLAASRYARMGMYTDGSVQGTRCLRRRPGKDECEYIPDIETFCLSGLFGKQIACIAGAGSSKNAPHLQPLTAKVENVLFEAHSHMRDIDGMHADEALDELCKILYTKLYDEEMTKAGKTYRLQRWNYGTTEEFAATVRKVYEEANDYDVRVFGLRIPGYERSRGVFGTAINLSSPAVAKVVETLQDYSLTESGIDVKGRAFQKVVGPAMRAGMGQYFTPHAVIEFMVEAAGPSVTELILDPFAGSGHFLTTALDYVRNRERKGKRLDEFAFNKLHGIEKSDRMVRIAMMDMRLHGDGHSNIRCTDALLDFSNYPDLQEESFDLILTNPPFGSLLGSQAIGSLGRFELAEGRKAVPLELLGLERCLQFLRPGGRMGIVMPESVLVNKATAYVRSWAAKKAKIRAIVSLPIETFSPYGANIKTSLLFLRKWKKGETVDRKYPVHLARVDNVGYDAGGRERVGAELQDSAEKLCDFLAKEGW
jgi:type I restriction enzyme M protein